jgi:hypothetical protein
MNKNIKRSVAVVMILSMVAYLITGIISILQR